MRTWASLAVVTTILALLLTPLPVQAAYPPQLWAHASQGPGWATALMQLETKQDIGVEFAYVQTAGNSLLHVDVHDVVGNWVTGWAMSTGSSASGPFVRATVGNHVIEESCCGGENGPFPRSQSIQFRHLQAGTYRVRAWTAGGVGDWSVGVYGNGPAAARGIGEADYGTYMLRGEDFTGTLHAGYNSVDVAVAAQQKIMLSSGFVGSYEFRGITAGASASILAPGGRVIQCTSGCAVWTPTPVYGPGEYTFRYQGIGVTVIGSVMGIDAPLDSAGSA